MSSVEASPACVDTHALPSSAMAARMCAVLRAIAAAPRAAAPAARRGLARAAAAPAPRALPHTLRLAAAPRRGMAARAGAPSGPGPVHSALMDSMRGKARVAPRPPRAAPCSRISASFSLPAAPLGVAM